MFLKIIKNKIKISFFLNFILNITHFQNFEIFFYLNLK